MEPSSSECREREISDFIQKQIRWFMDINRYEHLKQYASQLTILQVQEE